jgi:uncharacterized membrane protein YkoI
VKSTFSVICVALAIWLSGSALDRVRAQEKQISRKEVPSAVVSAFEKAYPKAVIKGFSQEQEEGKIYYEVESQQGNTTRDILYLADGTVVELEEGVPAADLPGAIQSALKAKYPKGDVTKAEKTTRGNRVTYEMKVVSGKSTREVVVDRSGKILKERLITAKRRHPEEQSEKEEK